MGEWMFVPPVRDNLTKFKAVGWVGESGGVMYPTEKSAVTYSFHYVPWYMRLRRRMPRFIVRRMP